MQISRALRSYLEDCGIGLAPATLQLYRANLNTLVAYLRRRRVARLERITPAHLRRYFADLSHPSAKQRPPSANTQHQQYRTARTWLNWCVRRGWLPANPLLQVRAPDLPKPVARHITRADMLRLVDGAGAGSQPERDRAIVLLFLDTGLRRRELARLTVDDVDLSGRRVTVRVGKGGRGRVVPISSGVAHALATWLVARPEETRGLFGLQTEGVYQMLQRLRRRAGLARLSPHMLRHTFATFYEGDVYDLAKILGHRDITVTAEVYAHREAARLAEMHDARSPAAGLG